MCPPNDVPLPIKETICLFGSGDVFRSLDIGFHPASARVCIPLSPYINRSGPTGETRENNSASRIADNNWDIRNFDIAQNNGPCETTVARLGGTNENRGIGDSGIGDGFSLVPLLAIRFGCASCVKFKSYLSKK